ncbi:MAG TPA: nuclear transport factor 2 family protein, partial [Anaerolineales bacterium]|jgi:hypothetical protein
MAGGRTDQWIKGYLAAWTSNQPGEIGALFTEDAAYYTAPYRPGWHGRQAIIDGWLDRKDAPDSWSFEYKVIVEQGDLGVIEGVTTYHDQGRWYSNLWLIWFDGDGRCRKFVEYFMQQPGKGDGR